MSPLFFALATGVFLFQFLTILADLRRVRRGAQDPARDYTAGRLSLGLAGAAAQFFLTLGWALAAGPFFSALEGHWPGWGLLTLAAGAQTLTSALVFLPLAWYRTFRSEARWGFNRTTGALFIQDRTKSLVLSWVITILAVNLAWGAWEITGPAFFIWLPLGGLVLGFLGLVLFPHVLAPLFQRFSPLPSGELRSQVEALVRHTGLKPAQICLADASRRSTHANAWVGGLGPWRRIVLFDNLTDAFPPAEVVAVLAHEIGHVKHRHLVRFLGLSAVAWAAFSLVLGVLWTWPFPFFSLVPGRELFLFFALFLLPALDFPLAFVQAAVSRVHERQADAYALSLGLGKSLASALDRMGQKSLVLKEPPFWTRLGSGHPVLGERLTNLDPDRFRARSPISNP